MKPLFTTLLATIGLAATPNVEAAPEDTGWSVRAREERGRPVIVRVRERFPAVPQAENYVWLTILTCQYSPSPSGLPSADDEALLNELEDALERHIEQPAIGIQIATVTGGGKRQWHYYSSDADRFSQAVAKLTRGKTPFRITTHSEQDPERTTFEKLRAQ